MIEVTPEIREWAQKLDAWETEQAEKAEADRKSGRLPVIDFAAECPVPPAILRAIRSLRDPSRWLAMADEVAKRRAEVKKKEHLADLLNRKVADADKVIAQTLKTLDETTDKSERERLQKEIDRARKTAQRNETNEAKIREEIETMRRDADALERKAREVL